MARYANGWSITGRCSHRMGGILTRSWNLVDWAALDISDYCVCTAYQGLLAYCFDCAARFAEMQEKQADAQKFTDTAKLLRHYLSQVLWGRYAQGVPR